jgi:hypothetical protein
VSRAAREQFLAGAHVARIATASASGLPYVTPVWYEWREGALRIVLARSRPHLANLRENPALAVCIDEDPRPREGLGARARGVTMIGRAQLSEPVALSDAEALVTPIFLRIAARYLGATFGLLESQPAEILAEPRGS